MYLARPRIHKKVRIPGAIARLSTQCFVSRIDHHSHGFDALVSIPGKAVFAIEGKIYVHKITPDLTEIREMDISSI